MSPPLAEGYLLATVETRSPSRLISNTKGDKQDRSKREAASDNQSTANAPSTTIESIRLGQLSMSMLNNAREEEPIISDIDADAWARSLSLSAVVDGSGLDSK
jgi:hypothetical protein